MQNDFFISAAGVPVHCALSLHLRRHPVRSPADSFRHRFEIYDRLPFPGVCTADFFAVPDYGRVREFPRRIFQNQCGFKMDPVGGFHQGKQGSAGGNGITAEHQSVGKGNQIQSAVVVGNCNRVRHVPVNAVRGISRCTPLSSSQREG